MKRILSLLVTFVVLLVLLSEIVYARSDAKELNGKVYVTDRIENYVCELDSAYKVAMIYKDNIIFYDPDSFSDSSEEEILKYLQSEELYPLYKYSIANDTCTEMSEKEKFDFYNEIYYSNVGRFSVSQIYEWEEDNKIYQVREINEYVLVYTVTEDTVVDSEKTYYFYDN